MIDPEVVEVLVRARSAGARSPLSVLTRREHDVLAELAQGKSNAAIAESLVLTKRAVEKHINAIFTKLELDSPDDVSRRVKAALIFLASGDFPFVAPVATWASPGISALIRVPRWIGLAISTCRRSPRHDPQPFEAELGVLNGTADAVILDSSQTRGVQGARTQIAKHGRVLRVRDGLANR